MCKIPYPGTHHNEKIKSPWLKHGSTIGNWVADHTIQAVPQFFFCLRRHFPFFAPQKRVRRVTLCKKLDFYTMGFRAVCFISPPSNIFVTPGA